MIDVVALALASDPRPDDNNVVAGWVGAVVLVGLVVAVVFILRSFTKQMKKVREARDAGVFDEEPKRPDGTGDPSDSTDADLPPSHHEA
jgi:TRAP-type C4-dicarboxylate transport system permease small subunit